MTDKDIKDYCKNCDVEPPAMRFKCPECEHNPNNENNFAKDINAPHKEQIIINGVDVSECLFYDDIKNYLGRCYNALEEIRKIIASTDVRTRPKLYDFEQDNKILDIISKVRMP